MNTDDADVNNTDFRGLALMRYDKKKFNVYFYIPNISKFTENVT